MKLVKFGDLRGGEAFDPHFEVIYEEGKDFRFDRPNVFVKIEGTNLAVFLPTGKSKEFSPNQKFELVELTVEIKL